MTDQKKKIWIDPPEGWRYGFPKLFESSTDMTSWLIENDYPKQIIEDMGDNFYVRCWYASEEHN